MDVDKEEIKMLGDQVDNFPRRKQTGMKKC